jgi:urease subunit alpha
MFGAKGLALPRTSVTFVSQAAAGVGERLGLSKMILPVKNCRRVTKADMRYNDRTGDIRVDSETYRVTVDGEVITSQAAEILPLTQKYFLF